MIDASKLSLFAVRVMSFAILETVSLSDCRKVFNNSALSSIELIKRWAFGNGKIYQQIELEQNNTIKIEQENGDYNEVVIQDGYVWMTDADCPDKLCVKHNKIHYNHETIVCLPHKVVVEIIGGEENTVDIIAK